MCTIGGVTILPTWATITSHFSFARGSLSPADAATHLHDAGYTGAALLDHDGLWGGIQHLQTCAATGLAAAIGVTLATDPTGLTARRNVRLTTTDRDRLRAAWGSPGPHGRAAFDTAPRCIAVATPDSFGALNRLVTAAHTTGPGSPPRPVASHDLLADFATAGGRLLMGHDSETGHAIATGRYDLALAHLDWWRQLLATPDAVAVLASTPSDTAMVHAGRHHHLPVVFAPWCRYLPTGRRQAQLLDALRTGTALRTTPAPARGQFVSAIHAAETLATLGDTVDRDRGRRLATDTHTWWQECTLTGADLGLDRAHPPEDRLVTGGTGQAAWPYLRDRCYTRLTTELGRTSGATYDQYADRLDAELNVVARLRYEAFFLATATIADRARHLGVRVQARGSAVGSLICHLLGLSPIDPIRHGLLAERFCTTLRTDLPDIDLDVESARRHEIYTEVFTHFGTDRVAAVGMVDTYRSRSAIRDVGRALGIAPGRVDQVAAAAPWHGSADLWETFTTLPELRSSRLVTVRDRSWLELAGSLAGLPRHASMHPCGIIVTGGTLHDRVALQQKGFPWPLAQLTKDDVETAGLLKADILGVRMQSAITHTVADIARTTGEIVDVDHIPVDDVDTFNLLRSTRTIGVFQVESPGQRALSGKLCPSTMTDITAQISLFRPGPVKADMITPFIAARHRLSPPPQWPDIVAPLVQDTAGVVIWHEQVMHIIAATAGVSLAVADQARRQLGSPEGRAHVASWWRPAALARLTQDEVAEVWQVMESFGSFGFCKAHAAAFARTTYESAWLKAHYPAQFFAGLLEHSPGLYSDETLLSEARRLGIAVRPVCAVHSDAIWATEPTGQARSLEWVPEPGLPVPTSPVQTTAATPRVTGWALRVPLTTIPGITEDECHRIVAGRPYGGISHLWEQTRLSGSMLEKLADAGALRCLYSAVESEVA